MQQAFSESCYCVSAGLGHVATNMPPDKGASVPPRSLDEAAGDAAVRNPLLEPLPPAPVGSAATSTTPLDTVPPMPIANATAAAVGDDGKTDADMPDTPPSAKPSAEEEAMACYKAWTKVARVVTLEEKDKGKGNEGSEVEEGATAAT